MMSQRQDIPNMVISGTHPHDLQMFCLWAQLIKQSRFKGTGANLACFRQVCQSLINVH